MLSKEAFAGVIKNAPLISIDLIVKNREGEILLGKRVNEPAKDFWFVPGGRIFKDENFNKAFSRICKDELNLYLTINDATFHGIYEHFYDNNVFNAEFSTHYVVLAYNITFKNEFDLPNCQHSEYIWSSPDSLIKRDDVHKLTKDYFRERE